MDKTLGDRLSNLRDSSAKVSAGIIDEGAAPWLTINGEDTLSGFDNDKIGKAFDRTDASREYLETIGPEGKLSDAENVKQESDMLSAMEREFRMRYRSRVRMFAHAAARVRTAGEGGGIFDTIARQQYSREGQP